MGGWSGGSADVPQESASSRLTDMAARGRDGGRDSREYGMDIYTGLNLNWITNKDYCAAQGTLLDVIWQTGGERTCGRMDTCVMYG